MSDIAGRFRHRLESDWPSALPDLLDAALVEEARNPEILVGRVLGQWSADETLDTSVREDLAYDALAFGLRDHHGGQWGSTHFGPWGSMPTETGEVLTAPPRERLTAEAVKHWRKRAETLDHHVARARFSDVAWDLANLAGIERRREDAVRAIDSYVGQCVSSGSVLRREECLRRAHALARAIADHQRAANVRNSLLELCRLTDVDGCERLRFLACDLYLLDQKADATDDEKALILGWIEEGLRTSVANGDPFSGARYGEKLDAYYRRRGDTLARQTAARSLGGLLEGWAAKGSGMLAMHNYKKAHEVYQTAGLVEEARAVRLRVQEATDRAQDEMQRLTTTIEVPRSEIDALIESIVPYEWRESVRRFVGSFLRRRSDFDSQLNAWIEGSAMYGVMGQTVVTQSGDSVEIKSPREDRESHTVLKGAELLVFEEGFLRLVLDELVTRHDCGPEELITILDESPLFPTSRRELLHRGVKAYCLADGLPGFLGHRG